MSSTLYSTDCLREHTAESLSSEDIYYGYHDSPVVWRPASFEKNLPFYPVYRWNGYVSHMPLYLMLKKGTFRPDGRAERAAAHPDFCHNPFTVDAEIERIPDRTDYTPEITSQAVFVAKVAEAMVGDVREIERRASHDVNMVLCGGKDSLNMLLLPWEKPVRVLSARPNYPLVQAFVDRNDLGYEVRKLKDGVDVRLTEEILLNACASDLEHCRWTGHLRRIVASTSGRCALWKGQLGGQMLTPDWRSQELNLYVAHAHGDSTLVDTLRSGVRRAHQLYRALRKRVDRTGYYFDQLWRRGAHWQGSHMALLREATGALVLSGYHGRRVTDVLHRTHIEAVATRDLRADLGAELHGSEVWYPDRNPGPEPSRRRRGVSTVERFRAAVEEAAEGIAVV